MGYRYTGRGGTILSLYIPKQGDIVKLNFEPQAGHEQKGYRPALVVSNNDFNLFTRIGAIVCPITNTNRKSSLHIKLPPYLKTTGFIMCEQLKSLDVAARGARFFEQIPHNILTEVLNVINLFF